MKKLRVAIVGCGRISVCYEDAFHKLDNLVELCCAVDKDLEKAKSFAEKFGCKYSSNIGDIYNEDIDIAHLCLPHYLHAPMAIDMMKHGIHVLTEKPIAISLQDADKMIEVSKDTEKKLGCIFQTRYNDSVQKIKTMYENGTFGKVVSARSYLCWNRPNSYYEDCDWKGTWDKEGGGTLIDQAIHSIDRVRYILGSDVNWIEGSIHNHCHKNLKVEDAAEAAIMFKNGCIYNLYSCNYYGFDSPINIEFIGEKGTFGLIQDMGYSKIGDDYQEYRETYKGEVIGKDYWGSTHYMQLQDFYQSVLEDRPIKVDGLEGRKTLEMVKGIYLSSILGKRIDVPYTDMKIIDIDRAED